MEKTTDSKPESAENNPQFHSFTEDFERQFFEGAEQVTVQITLMRDTWDAILDAMKADDWKQNEGLIVLITTGLAYLNAERALKVDGGAAGLRDEEVKKLLDRAITMEAKYAAMKNFAFDIMRDHQALEMRYTPIEQQYAAYKAMALRLRDENGRLKTENEQLKQQLDMCRAELASQATSQPAASPWQQFLNRLRGKA